MNETFEEFETDEIIGAMVLIDKKMTLIASNYIPPNKERNLKIFEKIDQLRCEFIVCSSHACFGSLKNNKNVELLVDIINQTNGIVIYNNYLC